MKKTETLYLIAVFPHASAEEFVLGRFTDLTEKEVLEVQDRLLAELPPLDPFPYSWLEPQSRLSSDRNRLVNLVMQWSVVEERLHKGDYGELLFDLRFWSSYRARDIAKDVRYERDRMRIVAALGPNLIQVSHDDTFDTQVFDEAGTVRWGPVQGPGGGVLGQEEHHLYRHPKGEWTLIVGSLEQARAKPGSARAYRLSDVQAVRWLSEHKLDPPEDVADLARLEFYSPEAASISSSNESLVSAKGRSLGQTSHAHEGRLTNRDLPHWDPERRQLHFRRQLCKQFKQPAPNQTLILDAFQEAGWPGRIDDPIPPRRESDHRQRLADAVRGLNLNRHLRFELDGTGEGILWSSTE
jgi:hypothetical protein